MFDLFAVTDPQATLASGNILAILSLIIVVLAGVVVYLAKKLFDNQRDNALEIKLLNQQLLSENKLHTVDYKQLVEKNQEVLQFNSQSNTLLAAKIEAVKGRQ